MLRRLLVAAAVASGTFAMVTPAHAATVGGIVVRPLTPNLSIRCLVIPQLHGPARVLHCQLIVTRPIPAPSV